MSDEQAQVSLEALNLFASNLLMTAGRDTAASFAREDVTACAGGMVECGPLLSADRQSTQRLREFITQVQQGFAGYAHFAHTSGRAYLGADDTARRAMLDVLRTHRGDGVPDVSPALLPPAED
ncbi:hypothetical protein [Saccharothrix variisporea]|uniref:Excreted virulence factor EspC (Type VII ESX diderm) n=1 Tax=Saccharothrix variisporea TaxID=543527 RepID=A0A495XEG6_9PSEU|nr:hypothetical protein [Saccharothrix variisporea]RKT72650.1 hypothetical protein DFJ66_5972 [Saccharothrix variisporea]